MSKAYCLVNRKVLFASKFWYLKPSKKITQLVMMDPILHIHSVTKSYLWQYLL